MCGIVGHVVRTGGAHLRSVRASTVLDELTHRGPNSRGEYRDGCVWIGHVRLSILDPTPAGSQPMLSRDGRFVISYNGEVYNFRELAKSLNLETRSRTDTEVVLEALARKGLAALPLFNGMFAFALYDTVDKRLWLVRDRLGIKPLYFRATPDAFSFASELGPLLSVSGASPTCDVSQLHEWLYYGTTLGANTPYEDVRKLLPGQYIELDAASLEWRTGTYWNPVPAREPKLRVGATERASRVLQLLDAAVERQLVSDVPVAVALSGGIDSSAIAAMASRHYPGRLATYTVGFDFDDGVDELRMAQRTAAHFGTDHHEVQLSGCNVVEVVEKMVDHHGHPFSDAANIPIFLIASRLGESAKVVLQGDGGDELFGGYSRYRSVSHPRLAAAASRVAATLTSLIGGSLQHRMRRYSTALNADHPAKLMALLLTEEGGASRPERIFTPAVRARVLESDPFLRYRQCQARVAGEPLVDQMFLVDSMIVLPDTFLEKVDRASMAASVEVRVPFLDHDLVELCLRLPGAHKVPGGRPKWLLRRAMADILPAEVVNRPKTGFGVPYGFWLRDGLEEFFHDSLSTFCDRYPDIIDRECVLQLHQQHVSRARDHSFLLWKVLNLTLWATRFNVAFA